MSEYAVASCGQPRMGGKIAWVRVSPIYATYAEAEKALQKFIRKEEKTIVVRSSRGEWEKA